MRTKREVLARFAATYVLLAIFGIAGFAYVLIHQRFSPGLGGNTYKITAAFTSANGVDGGVGQPVNVVGVPVGQITDVTQRGGVALVTMQINRRDLPHVHGNATAALKPVTPLGDIRVDLDPGGPPSEPLRDGGDIGLARTAAPVPLSDLLSRLDVDTRDYLTTLLGSLERGTAGRGPDMRRLLLSLGPTSRQVGDISRSLAARRTALAEFVHNLAEVTHAASEDGELSTVVTAGNRTLRALAREDAPLRASLAKLPGTLSAARSTLENLKPFAGTLRPTLASLQPAVDRLPTTLDALAGLSDVGTPVIRDDLSPLVRKLTPVLRRARPAIAGLKTATPPLTGTAQTLNYVLNELAHVPGGSNQGFLFWTDWVFHNLNSALSTGDANGSVLRAAVLQDCLALQGASTFRKFLDLLGVCPN